MLRVTPTLAIDPSDLEESFVRSGGPGGQNVNKVSTAVQLKFDVARSQSLPDAVRQRLVALAGRRLTADGLLIITANRFRSQARNRQDARDRLVELVRKAAAPPVPRRTTSPPKASKVQRRADKLQRAKVKSLRRRPAGET